MFTHDDMEHDEESEDDDVRKAFAEKEYVNVVLCTSDQNNASKMFTIVKEREKDTKYITDMRLILTDNNVLDLEVDQADDDTAPIHSFFLTSDEYGDNVDSYVQISNKMIKVYDKSMQMKWTFDNLNIRACHDVHQGYLYVIGDQSVRPYTITDET